MHLHGDALILVGVVIGFFVLALLCLACSLNPREILDCSIVRCCRRRRRRRGDDDDDDDEPNTYETLNEFIFESGDEEQQGMVTSLNSDEPTTLRQVFPDLLGGGGGDNNINTGTMRGNENDGNRSGQNNTTQNSNAELSEPLL